MQKPTQDDLDLAVEVLQAYALHLETYEQYATTTLSRLEFVISSIDGDVDELFELPGDD